MTKARITAPGIIRFSCFYRDLWLWGYKGIFFMCTYVSLCRHIGEESFVYISLDFFYPCAVSRNLLWVKNCFKPVSFQNFYYHMWEKKFKSDFKERFHPNLCSIKSSECAFFTHLGLQERGSLSSFSRIVLYYCLVKYAVVWVNTIMHVSVCVPVQMQNNVGTVLVIYFSSKQFLYNFGKKW